VVVAVVANLQLVVDIKQLAVDLAAEEVEVLVVAATDNTIQVVVAVALAVILETEHLD
jgi:hypothetical protein